MIWTIFDDTHLGLDRPHALRFLPHAYSTNSRSQRAIRVAADTQCQPDHSVTAQFMGAAVCAAARGGRRRSGSGRAVRPERLALLVIDMQDEFVELESSQQ
ncbi:hypothetical protein ACFC96_31725 [Streptomyces sp. NPDC055955]|uniref:hypothetical protein n=1 Tax=Streptomyces sp. NPDC055955 TaxID=3345665 RepID=UPI0035D59AE3